MKVLVTGGAGFIGSNFVRYWLSKYPEDSVRVLDKLTYAGHIHSLDDLKGNSNYEFVKGDICSERIVSSAIKGVNILVHFAAESHVDRSIVDPMSFIKTNVFGTAVLLENALKSNISHFHYVGTDEVFGSLNLKSKNKFSEKSSYDPRSPYSASKAGADHLVRAYYHTFGLPVTITNCSNNFGPYQDPEKFLPRLITNLIDGEKLPIYGDGKNVRDWLHVQDHCRAIDLVTKKGKIGETYLVGGLTKDINNLEIAKSLIKIFGKDKSCLKFVEDRKGHDRRYAVNWNKIKKLGWEPEYNFETWLSKTVEWYKENELWWRPLKEEAEKLYTKTGQK